MDKKELYALGDDLFSSPNLGYKEFTNKRKLEEYFKKHNLKTKDLGFETAFSVTIGEGRPKIGLIAELDGLSTPGHRCANPLDSDAAHSCGHSTQCAIMASALVELSKEKINGTITLFFTPAEEYVDIEYRKKLIEEGKIKYIGGKINMLEAHMFDDYDLFIHLHTSNNQTADFDVNSTLGGFVYKEISFIGKNAHAAVAPHLGINALDMFVDFYNDIKDLKEKTTKENLARIHGIIVQGGESVNSIPALIKYECYVRSADTKELLYLSQKVDELAHKNANKYGGSAKIETRPGYLPLNQSKLVNEVIEKHMREFTDKIRRNTKSIAAGDVGDISVFKPIVQFGYTGFVGVCHNKDLEVADYEKAYYMPSMVVYKSALELVNNRELVEKIKNEHEDLMSWQDYLNYINAK